MQILNESRQHSQLSLKERKPFHILNLNFLLNIISKASSAFIAGARAQKTRLNLIEVSLEQKVFYIWERGKTLS